MSIINRLDRFVKKFDYDTDVIRLALSYANNNKPVSFKHNDKTNRLTLTDLKFLHNTSVKKDSEGLSILPILAGAAALGAKALAAKRINDNRKELEELKAKSGAFIPLLTLIPIIASVLGGVGAAAGGAAGIAKTVLDKRAADEAAKRDAEFKRQQITADAEFKRKLIDTLNSSSASESEKQKHAKN